MRKNKPWMVVIEVAVFLTSCSGTRITRTHVDDTHVGTPVKDVLIIAIIDYAEIREFFETYFLKKFNAAGVEAFNSAEVLPISAGTKPKKESIFKVIAEHGSDTVAITHLVGLEESEVFSRANSRSHKYYSGYYLFYDYAWDYVHAPAVYGERVAIRLETRL